MKVRYREEHQALSGQLRSFSKRIYLPESRRSTRAHCLHLLIGPACGMMGSMNDGRHKEEESSNGPPASSSRDTSIAATGEFNAPAIRLREIPEQTAGRKTLPPMLDVQAPHETVHRWKDFFIHIATIVIGLLIAAGLEQTVEYFHHRHQVAEMRKALEVERHINANEFGILTEDFHRVIPKLQANMAVYKFLQLHPHPNSGPVG